MKYILIIILLSFILDAQSQSVYRFDHEMKLVDFSDQEYKDCFFQMLEFEGNFGYTGNYLNGKKNGLFVFKRGIKYIGEIYYQSDSAISYYFIPEITESDETIRQLVSNIKTNKRTSQSILYNDLKLKTDNNENINGIYIVDNDNNDMFSVETFKNGKRDGQQIWFSLHNYHKHLVASVNNYRNGILHGYFSVDGSKGFYADGKKTGIWKNLSGTEESEIHYINGKKEGLAVYWYGSQVDSVYFQNDVKIDQNTQHDKHNLKQYE